jgi:hypothetical protein
MDKTTQKMLISGMDWKQIPSAREANKLNI